MFQHPKGYVLVNRAKREEAAAAAERSGNSVLAEYDKRGGLIKDSKGNSISSGSFWDFKAGKPVVKRAKKAVSKKK